MRNRLLMATALAGAFAVIPAIARAQDTSRPLAHNFDLTFEGGYSIGASEENALAQNDSDKLSGFSNLPPGDDGFRFAIKGEYYLDPTWSIIGGLQTENLESEDTGCANYLDAPSFCLTEFVPGTFTNDVHRNSLDLAAAYRFNENLQIYGGLRGLLQSNQIRLSADDGSYNYYANDHLWAFGPLVGARGQMMLGDGLSLRAEVAGSVLFGHRRGDVEADKLGDLDEPHPVGSYDEAETLYMLGGNAALHYQVNDSLDLALGYGVQQSWNAAGKFDADKVGDNDIEDQPFGSSDILTHGPFVQVNLTF